MSINDVEINDVDQRRERINRLKSAIVKSIIAWIIISIIVIVVLVVQVIRLSNKVNNYEKIISTGCGTESGGLTTEADGQKQDTPEDNIPAYGYSPEGIDNPENLAKDGDLHKVYLTFDSVPGENTMAILDELKASNIKAAFFVSGSDSPICSEVCKRIVSEGHTLGMHSFSDKYSTVYASKDAFTTDMDQIHDLVFQAAGVEAGYYRFLGGSGNTISNVSMTELASIVYEKGYTIFDWNVSAGDSVADYTVSDVVDNVTEGIKKYKTSVVLLHDDSGKTTTAEAISPLVSALKELQAEILPIDEDTYVVSHIKAN